MAVLRPGRGAPAAARGLPFACLWRREAHSLPGLPDAASPRVAPVKATLSLPRAQPPRAGGGATQGGGASRLQTALSSRLHPLQFIRFSAFAELNVHPHNRSWKVFVLPKSSPGPVAPAPGAHPLPVCARACLDAPRERPARPAASGVSPSVACSRSVHAAAGVSATPFSVAERRCPCGPATPRSLIYLRMGN